MDEQLLLEVISRAETAGLEQVKDMLNQNTDAYEKYLNTMERGSGAAQEAEQAQQGLTESVGKWSTAQKVGMGIAAGAITGLIGVAMGGMKELSGLTREYRAQTGATAEEAKKAIEVTREYYRTTTLGYKEIMGVVQGLRQEMGITEDKASDLTGQIIMFAQATGMNAEQAMTLLTKNLKAFNIPASEMAATMDKIVSASQQTGQGVGQLSGSLSMLAPYLSRANMGMDEGIAFMEMFKTAGINASMAPRLLMMAMNKVKSPEQFQRMLKDIQSTENDSQRAAKAVQLFGSRGAAMALVLKPGAKTLEDWTRELQGLGPVTKTAADIMNASLGTKLQILFKNAQDRVVEFGQKYGQVVMTISTLGTAVVGVARQLNVDLVGALSNAAMKVAVVAKDIGASIVGGIVPKVGWAADLVVSIASGIKDLAGSAIVGAAKAAGAVIGGAYRLAVAAAGKVVDLVSGAWEAVSKSSAIRAIVSAAGSIVGGLYGAAVNLAAQASDFIATTWQEVTGNAAVKTAAVAAGEVVGFLYSSALNLTAQLSEFVVNSFTSLGGNGAVMAAIKSVATKFGAVFSIGEGAQLAGAAGGAQFADAFVGGVDDSGFETGVSSSLYADLTGRTLSGEIGRAANRNQRAYISEWMDNLAPKLSARFGGVLSAITFPARVVAAEAKFAASLVRILAGGFAQSGRAIGDLFQSTLGKALAGVSGVSGALNLKGLLSGLTGQSREVSAGLGAHLKSIWTQAGAMVAPAASLVGKAGVAAYQLGTAAAEKVAGFGAMLARGWKNASALVVAEARAVGSLAILAHGEAVRLGGQIGDLLAPLWLKSKAAVALAAQQVGFVAAYAHSEAVLLRSQIASLLAGIWAKVGPIVMPIAHAVGTVVGLAYQRGVDKASAIATALSGALAAAGAKLAAIAGAIGIGAGSAAAAGIASSGVPASTAAGAQMAAGMGASLIAGATASGAAAGAASALAAAQASAALSGTVVLPSGLLVPAASKMGKDFMASLGVAAKRLAGAEGAAVGATFLKSVLGKIAGPLAVVIEVVFAIKAYDALVGAKDMINKIASEVSTYSKDEFMGAYEALNLALKKEQENFDPFGDLFTAVAGGIGGALFKDKNGKPVDWGAGAEHALEGASEQMQVSIDNAVGNLNFQMPNLAEALAVSFKDPAAIAKIAMTLEYWKKLPADAMTDAAKMAELAALDIPEAYARSLISGKDMLKDAIGSMTEGIPDAVTQANAKIKAVQLGMDPKAVDEAYAQAERIRKAPLGGEEGKLAQWEIDKLDKATKVIYYSAQDMATSLVKGYVEGLEANQKTAVEASERAKNAWWKPFAEKRSATKGMWDTAVSAAEKAQAPAARAAELLAQLQSSAYLNGVKNADPEVRNYWQKFGESATAELKALVPEGASAATTLMKKMGEAYEDADLVGTAGRVFAKSVAELKRQQQQAVYDQQRTGLEAGGAFWSGMAEADAPTTKKWRAAVNRIGDATKVAAETAGIQTAVSFWLGMANEKKQAEELAKQMAELVKNGWTGAQWTSFWKRQMSQSGLAQALRSDKPEAVAAAQSLVTSSMKSFINSGGEFKNAGTVALTNYFTALGNGPKEAARLAKLAVKGYVGPDGLLSGAGIAEAKVSGSKVVGAAGTGMQDPTKLAAGTSAGEALWAKFNAAVAAGTVSGDATTAVTTGVAALGRLYEGGPVDPEPVIQSGRDLTKLYGDGISDPAAVATATTQAGTVVSAVTNVLNPATGFGTVLADYGATSGTTWMNSFIGSFSTFPGKFWAGIARYITPYLKGKSPPSVGPLREIDAWGLNVGASYMAGMATGVSDAATLNKALAELTVEPPTLPMPKITVPDSIRTQGSAARAKHTVDRESIGRINTMPIISTPAEKRSESERLLGETANELRIQSRLLAQMVAQDPLSATPASAQSELARQQFIMAPGGRL